MHSELACVASLYRYIKVRLKFWQISFPCLLAEPHNRLHLIVINDLSLIYDGGAPRCCDLGYSFQPELWRSGPSMWYGGGEQSVATPCSPDEQVSAQVTLLPCLLFPQGLAIFLISQSLLFVISCALERFIKCITGVGNSCASKVSQWRVLYSYCVFHCVVSTLTS